MSATQRFGFSATLTAILASSSAAVAQQTPSPPVASPAPVAATAPKLPANFDPCGGLHELVNKIGLTPCVFVPHEVLISAGWAIINVNGNASATGPFGRTFTTGISGKVIAYPISTVIVGVTSNAQLQLTPQSYARVDSGRFGTLFGGSTDWSFSFKQRVYFNPKIFTQAAIEFTYGAPTGSPALTAPGPSYALNPIVAQPLTRTIAVAVGLSVKNEADAVTVGSRRRTTFTPTLVPFWASPGGTLLGVVGSHSFQPNVTTVAGIVEQQFGHHLLVSAAYGGNGVASEVPGPLLGLIPIQVSGSPRAFAANVYWMIGNSVSPNPYSAPPPPQPH
jgi:hypothetical protein